MVVGVDDSEHSLYALGWTVDHFFVPFVSKSPFNLVVVHAKPTASSAVGLAGPGTSLHISLFLLAFSWFD